VTSQGDPRYPAVDPAVAAEYRARGWWGDETLARRIAALAASTPERPAYLTPQGPFSWRDYDEVSTAWASALAGLDVPAGARVAVLLPDGPAVHAAFVAVEKAGLVIVGIGARAGAREVRHLLDLTGARVLVTSAPEVAAGHDLDHVVVVPAAPGVGDGTLVVDGAAVPVTGAAPGGLSPLGADDLFLLNSTSGTTGLPKCVMHTQNRWFYFHQLAVEAGGLVPDDVFFGAIPAPFGFGLWTAHFSPTILGSPTVIADRFDAGAALDLIERERVTVLCCVSTQFIMLLNAQAERARDLSSLRAMFTGGEAVPYERAAEFEQETGASLLQFYGSNETGALSHTSWSDTRDRRLRTAGRLIDDMRVRLFDPETGADITGSARPGQPGCRGPATCIGYWGDEAANAQLVRPDGWMLMGDIVEIDHDGYLRVVGRTSDFIIRGGKNVSAPAVEQEVGTHPGVAIVAAVPSPDPVFGERVCVYVVPRPGATVTLEDLVAHLAARGVSKEWFPERLVVMDELPRSSGGKVAKGELREDARRRFGG
jgi:acyl-CoA synthetase